MFEIPSSRQLQDIADRHHLGEVLDVERLGGSVGNNLAIRTEGESWVLRAAVSRVTAVDLRRERFFARLLSERATIGSPWPYLVDESEDITGWAYGLMPRLAGKVLHPGLQVRWDRIGGALGRAASEVHRVTFPAIGEWDADKDDIVPLGVASAERFRSRAEKMIEEADLDRPSATLVTNLVDATLPAIGRFVPSYVHGDLGISNLVGARGPDGFRFTGVFDLGQGYVGDPDEDLALPIWWPLYWGNTALSRAFFAGYRGVVPARPFQTARLRGYVGVSLLSNWATGHRLGYDWYGGATSFTNWARPLLDQATDVISGHRISS